MKNEKILKEKRLKEKEKRMEEKTVSMIAVVIVIIGTWDKIITFIQSFSNGFFGVLNSLPPIIVLGLIIWVLLWLGNKK